MKYFHNKYSCFKKLLYKSECPCYNASEICKTLGGGGHASLVLSRLTTGKLVCLDQDMAAIENDITCIRIVLGSLLSGLGANYIRERLRDTYV